MLLCPLRWGGGSRLSSPSALALRPVRVLPRPAPTLSGGFGSSCSVVSVRSCFAWLSLRLSALAFASPYCVRPHAPYFDYQSGFCFPSASRPASVLVVGRSQPTSPPPPLAPLAVLLGLVVGLFGFPESVGRPRCPPWWLPPVYILSNGAIPVKHFLHYMEGIFFSTSAKRFKAFILKGSQGLKAVIFSGIEQEAESVKHYPVRKCPILCEFAQICPCFSF